MFIGIYTLDELKKEVDRQIEYKQKSLSLTHTKFTEEQNILTSAIKKLNGMILNKKAYTYDDYIDSHNSMFSIKNRIKKVIFYAVFNGLIWLLIGFPAFKAHDIVPSIIIVTIFSIFSICALYKPKLISKDVWMNKRNSEIEAMVLYRNNLENRLSILETNIKKYEDKYKEECIDNINSDIDYCRRASEINSYYGTELREMEKIDELKRHNLEMEKLAREANENQKAEMKRREAARNKYKSAMSRVNYGTDYQKKWAEQEAAEAFSDLL